ncbi:MAG: hypothetical protein WC444_01145 [Candidatus Paceibacterota bacterium]
MESFGNNSAPEKVIPNSLDEALEVVLRERQEAGILGTVLTPKERFKLFGVAVHLNLSNNDLEKFLKEKGITVLGDARPSEVSEWEPKEPPHEWGSHSRVLRPTLPPDVGDIKRAAAGDVDHPEVRRGSDGAFEIV